MANGNATIMKKKMLAVFICLVMVAGLIPTVAFAAENEVDVWDGTSDTSWYNQTDTEFHIKTAEQLAGLAELTNICLLYTSPSPRDAHESRMPSSA